METSLQLVESVKIENIEIQVYEQDGQQYYSCLEIIQKLCKLQECKDFRWYQDNNTKQEFIVEKLYQNNFQKFFTKKGLYTSFFHSRNQYAIQYQNMIISLTLSLLEGHSSLLIEDENEFIQKYKKNELIQRIFENSYIEKQLEKNIQIAQAQTDKANAEMKMVQAQLIILKCKEEQAQIKTKEIQAKFNEIEAKLIIIEKENFIQQQKLSLECQEEQKTINCKFVDERIQHLIEKNIYVDHSKCDICNSQNQNISEHIKTPTHKKHIERVLKGNIKFINYIYRCNYCNVENINEDDHINSSQHLIKAKILKESDIYCPICPEFQGKSLKDHKTNALHKERMRNDEKEKKFNEYELDLKEKIKKALKK